MPLSGLRVLGYFEGFGLGIEDRLRGSGLPCLQ